MAIGESSDLLVERSGYFEAIPTSFSIAWFKILSLNAFSIAGGAGHWTPSRGQGSQLEADDGGGGRAEESSLVEKASSTQESKTREGESERPSCQPLCLAHADWLLLLPSLHGELEHPRSGLLHQFSFTFDTKEEGFGRYSR